MPGTPWGLCPALAEHGQEQRALVPGQELERFVQPHGWRVAPVHGEGEVTGPRAPGGVQPVEDELPPEAAATGGGRDADVGQIPTGLFGYFMRKQDSRGPAGGAGQPPVEPPRVGGRWIAAM